VTEYDQIIDDLGRFSNDPLGFVMWAFPWGEPGPLAARSGPEVWQREALLSIGRGLSPEAAVRQATKSGNGVGKSTFVSWIVLWAHSTFPDTRGIVTANTDTQLKTKTWPELSKWFQHFIAKDLFELTATSMFSRDPARKLTWRTDAIPWSENNPAAFQGLHNQGKRQFIIMDEASGIPEVIWEAAEGCMTDANTERLFLVFGNPNFPEGRFKECFPGGRYAGMWTPRSVDSRTVSFSDKKWIEGMIQAEGLDSDFVRVRVLGEFPRHAVTSFISQWDVDEARVRELPDWRLTAAEPLVMGVDVARFGDDASCITFRRGRDARSIAKIMLRGADTVQLATRVATLAREHHAEAIFVDGTGVGGGVVDQLRRMNLHVWDVQFGAKPDKLNTVDPYVVYANKRAEIWGAMRDWLKTGCIEDDKDLSDELVGPTYSFNGTGAIQLERKEDMKKRGLPSPDRADALALTFAYPIFSRASRDIPPADSLVVSEYDPFDAKFLQLEHA
jgi:hypothetical protein